MKKAFLSIAAALAVAAASPAADPPLPKDVPTYLQDISVTIHAGRSEGSGTITTRDGVNYVWTAAHVVSSLRKTREIVDAKTGSHRTVVEFDDAKVVKELIEDGRSVGKMEMDAEVIRYSNADTGHDLALLRVRKKNFVSVSAVFYNETADGKPVIKPQGTKLLHCGSLLGQMGSNSMTDGIVSQVGRVYKNYVFDQTTCAAFPGSSGGGVYLADGRYYGMIVRGAGETFNLIVPLRRLAAWADKVGVKFAIDPSVPVPSAEELRKLPVEDEAAGGSHQVSRAADAPITAGLNFLIRTLPPLDVFVPASRPVEKK